MGSIVLNVEDDVCKRLNDYIFDIDLFLNNLPQYHPNCLSKYKSRLQSFRKKRKGLIETDFSLCIFCQEHKVELLNNFSDQGFVTFLQDLNTLDDEMIEKLSECFNFDRIRKLVEVESVKEEFSPNKFKIHKICRHRFRMSYRRKKNLKTSLLNP